MYLVLPSWRLAREKNQHQASDDGPGLTAYRLERSTGLGDST